MRKGSPRGTHPCSQFAHQSPLPSPKVGPPATYLVGSVGNHKNSYSLAKNNSPTSLV